MSKRPSPKQSNTIDKYFGPTRPKRLKIDEAGESSASRTDENVAEEARQAGQAAEAAVRPAQKRIGRTGRPRRDSPRPGPSTAADTASVESISPSKRMYRPDLETVDGGDSSSVCSSDPPIREVGAAQSVEDMDVDVHSEDEEEIVKPKKRSRIQVVDDSSESDGGSPKKTLKKIKVRKSSDSDDENNSPNTPKVQKTPKRINNGFNESDDDEGEGQKTKKLLREYSFQKGTPVKEALNQSTSQKKDVPEVVKDIHSNWAHNSLEFLRPDKIRDINRNKPDHPDYDPRTLFVPDSFLKGLSPAMRQWWELKSQHMDSVLFFKVGKFYELYHMDAVIGVTQLGFSYMKGEFAHSGFPEIAYAKMASALIEKGFKVARVEQTETPEMMAERCKSKGKTTKFDKVVKREICQVSSKATCVYTAQMPEARNELPNYMYAVSMKIITERGAISKKFSEMLNSYFKDVRKESLSSKTQFYTASDTLEKLSMACYFQDKEGNFCWPDFFKKVADDCLPKPEYELAIRCLGACMWYLKNSKLDIQVLSMGKFQWYDPLDLISNNNIKNTKKDYLILDSVTINNLNLLGTKGTLQHVLDHCETAFGKSIEHVVLGSIRMVINLLHKVILIVELYFMKLSPIPKQKLRIFLKTLKAFEKAQALVDIFNDCESRLLRKVTQFSPKGANIDLSESLQFFKELLVEMLKAESERAKIVLDLNRRIFEKFSERHDQFDQPQLIINNGRYPCMPNIDNFVPNDIKMGVEKHADILIITGPNMGGKSTLMRQVAVISIMAQMGSCVPASSCHLNLMDRVFTRLGSQDDIIQGQSTFFVELSEASCILQHATKHSLVLIDELGRGTSTHDGNAIATAYVKKLTGIGCRTMFSTHYHSLVDNFIGREDIQLGHMACMVENDEDSTQESVTFLYKIVEGRCPKSYGFNAARLAGLDHKIVAKGREIAKQLEEESKLRNIFHTIFTSQNMSQIRKALESVL
ncbi:hypothetical protein NQ314_009180 [Rhamnusium bicolor]|uniref:DNA mismatch repair proteins mutS family domain-containing protein n=1 Tax=Rhamnusium bicolor TaxID=1586634 RepID=A0AAV8Y535_9CUCU|nr:hypothetical protein NQ314_009180 [Rhamnusium bicolor]